MANEASVEVIKHYLQNAIATERGIEAQFSAFAAEGEQAAVKNLFHLHAQETKGQRERLTARLEALGGSPSIMKSFLAHVFNFAPKTPPMGHDATWKNPRDLIAAYAIENSGIAMYEELAILAGTAGDLETERLGRTLQQEGLEAAKNIWNLIGASCHQAMLRTTTNPANVS